MATDDQEDQESERNEEAEAKFHPHGAQPPTMRGTMTICGAS